MNEVLKKLIDLSPTELRTVIAEARERLTKSLKNELKIGTRVKVVRDNNSQTYIITVINTVNVKMKLEGTNKVYNCPPSLLEIVE